MAEEYPIKKGYEIKVAILSSQQYEVPLKELPESKAYYWPCVDLEERLRQFANRANNGKMAGLADDIEALADACKAKEELKKTDGV